MKTLKCRDAGFDCNAEARGNSDQEVLEQAGKHAREVHGVTVTPELAAKLQPLIKEDGAKI